MYCPNCGTMNNENDSFCKGCGTTLKTSVQNNQVYSSTNNMQVQSNSGYNYQNQPVNQMNGNYDSYNQNQVNNQAVVNNAYQNPSVNQGGYDYHSQFQNQPVNPTSNNEDLVDAYIGKNVDKIKTGNFSFPTFFLGILYTFYRKMWGLGLIWWLVSLVAAFIPVVSAIAPLGLGIIFSIKFNKIYVNKVREKVEKIVQNNPGKSRDELRKICSQKGGTTILPVIIIPIIVVFAIALIIVPVVVSVIDEADASAAKTEAQLIVTGVNGECSSAEMKYQLGAISFNPCSDGVTKYEVEDLTNIGNASIMDIEYKYGKVTYLKVKTNGKTVEYNGYDYSIID